MSTVVRCATVDAASSLAIERCYGRARRRERGRRRRVLGRARASAPSALAFVWVRVRRGAASSLASRSSVAIGCLVGLRVEHRLPAPLVVGVVLLAARRMAGPRPGDHGTRALVRPGSGGARCGAPGRVGPAGCRCWSPSPPVVGGVLGRCGSTAVMPRVLPLLLAIGAVGVYVCVPDTEAPKALLGALLAGTVIALEPRLGHAARPGHADRPVRVGGGVRRRRPAGIGRRRHRLSRGGAPDPAGAWRRVTVRGGSRCSSSRSARWSRSCHASRGSSTPPGPQWRCRSRRSCSPPRCCWRWLTNEVSAPAPR